MKLKEDNIDIYNNSAVILNNKNPSLIKYWITILIILYLLFLVLLFIPFNIYSNYIGHVILKENESYISITLDKSDFPINKNNKLYIKDKSYKYNVIHIEDNSVLINIKLDENIRINNNMLVVNILKNRTTIFKIIKNKIKKGFDL
jgi:hypothetical protein